ncbi:hypothetical protein A5774_07520 [Corynebacterium sp. EPI-003-04-2554_SCH2473622]|nr:hypothetical protein A5774_07520 [Corynebacterium sp. EPI-003-04-2554_SCH2473622]
MELDLPLDLLDFSELDFWEPDFSLDLSVDLPELFSVDFPEDFSLDFPVDSLADDKVLAAIGEKSVVKKIVVPGRMINLVVK